VQMKSARLIYNPVAGKKAVPARLDNLVEIFQSRGWQVLPYRTTGKEDKMTYAGMLQSQDFDAVIVAGGDGTVHQVVNGMMTADLNLPLGIIPVGTSNDFAGHLDLPSDIGSCAELILKEKTTKIDLCCAGGSYFVNVASAGLLTDVPRETEVAMKNVWGKLAYYIKGIEKLPNFRAIPVEIAGDQKMIKEDILLFLIVNGGTVGGFSRLAPWASMTDGVFDVIVVKPCNLGHLFSLFIKLMKGEHINDPKVEYFQTSRLTINCPDHVNMDLDGEPGPGFPVEVSNIPGRLEVFTPKKFSSKAGKKVSREE